MTVVNPPSRFGSVQLKNLVTKFSEKPIISNFDKWWLFCLRAKIFDYIPNKNTIWEKEPLQNLSKNKKLNAYLHKFLATYGYIKR